jgi:hypothetical protein
MSQKVTKKQTKISINWIEGNRNKFTHRIISNAIRVSKKPKLMSLFFNVYGSPLLANKKVLLFCFKKENPYNKPVQIPTRIQTIIATCVWLSSV